MLSQLDNTPVCHAFLNMSMHVDFKTVVFTRAQKVRKYKKQTTEREGMGLVIRKNLPSQT